jgi:hypothetical protein
MMRLGSPYYKRINKWLNKKWGMKGSKVNNVVLLNNLTPFDGELVFLPAWIRVSLL